MPISETTKSPLNVAVGKLISRLRQDSTLASAATAFGISERYLKMIERGSMALPPYAAVALATEFHVNFASAAVLLVLADFLDKRIPGTRYYDLPEIVARAPCLEKVIGPLSPALSIVANWLVRTIGELHAGETAYEVDSIVELLERSIRTPPIQTLSIDTKGPVVAGGSPEQMSPVFEETLESLSAQLVLFQPNIDAQSLNVWRRLNAFRVRAVRAYVDRPDRLAKSIGESDWRFLNNGIRPNVLLLVPSSEARDVGRRQTEVRAALQRKFAHLGPETGRKLAANVVVKACADSYECNSALYFDFVTRSMPDPQEERRVRDSRQADGRYCRFTNAWVYELEGVRLGVDGRQNGSGESRHVGFLDANRDERATTFAVAMDRKHLDYWQQLFEHMGPTDRSAPAIIGDPTIRPSRAK